jgi:hypothetical protein
MDIEADSANQMLLYKYNHNKLIVFMPYIRDKEKGKVLKKKVTWECPCGFVIEDVSEINEAVTVVKMHIEKFHKDYLPFGITRTEILMLLKLAEQVKPKTKSAEEIAQLN